MVPPQLAFGGSIFYKCPAVHRVSVAIGASPSSDLNLLYSGNLWDYLGETQKRRSSVTTRDDLRERDVA